MPQNSTVAAGGSGVTAAVVGNGPLLAEMRTRAAGLGLVPPPAGAMPAAVTPEPPAATVEFCGSLADHAAVIGRMKSAGVLALPSTREGFGLVLAEAMACGTPCIAYDVPAVREVLADGEAGVLVPPRDVIGLAAACDRLLDDAAERKRLIAAGRRRVAECFADETFAGGMLAAYGA
ncbi:MAG: glycosyltransferase [Planctomycetia bacterium]|nr:glycosyltransferase [Planctomycetia bacterium]